MPPPAASAPAIGDAASTPSMPKSAGPYGLLRFDRQTAGLFYVVIAFLVGLVFASDLITRLGISVWIFYLVPLALCLLAPRAQLPLLVALAASVLIAAGYWLSPPGLDLEIARTNRSFGVVVIWGVAFLARWLIEARQRVQRLNWLQSGQARVSGEMVGEGSLAQMGQRLLDTLAGQLGAAVGALYLLQDGRLERVAGWALDEGAGGAPVRLAMGEGLVGQVARDGKARVVEGFSADALRVSSAVATTAAAQVLTAPVTADGEVLGVVELGFVGDARPAEDRVELLRMVGERAGMALRSAVYRERLEALLLETQRQGEALQTQAEELRVSNEELEEQGRALRESQVRLENQQAELEQTNVQLEEQAQSLEQQRAQLLESQSRLQANTRALEQASRYKSEFLANMSHELRTPLNSALILSKLLADNKGDRLSPEQVRYAQTIYAANNDLLALINDILGLSKIEAGRVELVPEELTLDRLLEPLRNAFAPVAAERGLGFDITLEGSLPKALVTDSQRVQQVLRNFLSNAFKFTERGRVALQVRPAGPDRIAFTVADTGIGIAPEQQAVVFEAFRQADGTTSRKYGGTGLGLSISRELTRLLGGRIDLQSAPGEGSRFTLELPIRLAVASTSAPSPALPPSPEVVSIAPVAAHARMPSGATSPADAVASSPAAAGTASVPNAATPSAASAQAAFAPAAARGPGRLILVVEDDPTFAQVLRDLVEELHYDSIHAGTARSALEMARSHRPDAVLLDIGLPDESGLSVLEQLKRDPATRHLPIHVVSGDDYRQTALELGAVGYALKPVAREELASAVHRIEEQLARRMRRVLVVEDDSRLRDSIRELLTAEDIEIVGVGTVAEAHARLVGERFDCVVMDLLLPDGTGYDLLERLSAEGAYAHGPVIVYTGRTLSRDEEQRLRRYSRSIIIKGARSPERLLDEVTLFLHQVESEMPAAKQRLLRQVRERDAAFEGRRILLAEDDARNVFALASVLEPMGAELVVARNGREALDKLAAGPAVDLVLMDVMMPEMDGLTAMREIRKQPQWLRLPVIALTAKAMAEDRKACLDAGASDYIPKPIEIDKLLSLCRVWMPK